TVDSTCGLVHLGGDRAGVLLDTGHRLVGAHSGGTPDHAGRLCGRVVAGERPRRAMRPGNHALAGTATAGNRCGRCAFPARCGGLDPGLRRARTRRSTGSRGRPSRHAGTSHTRATRRRRTRHAGTGGGDAVPRASLATPCAPAGPRRGAHRKPATAASRHERRRARGAAHAEHSSTEPSLYERLRIRSRNVTANPAATTIPPTGRGGRDERRYRRTRVHSRVHRPGASVTRDTRVGRGESRHTGAGSDVRSIHAGARIDRHAADMTSHHDTGSSGHEHRSGTTSRAGGTTGTTGPGDTVAERYRRRAAEFTRRVLAVPDGAWNAPSPCAGWSARDVLAHMLDNHREMPGYAGLTLTIDTPVERDPYGAWQQARERMQDLLQDPARARAEYTGHF